ncbi:hypothetical protein KIF24_31165 [Micromonospora sp. Llam7]|uniref:hypothetical protein n=1 Tax=Micromonospora tarapacensis TaxID=2835305 RepID=UPI001C83E244|nr:hypothetical protein [Micromonospora tarapacensis]MBX7270044.1 hypothetical protein [Micromonospora tarapacensis]
MTLLTQNARREMIAQAQKAVVPEQADRRPFEWRGARLMIPAIAIPVADVLLNPRTHRVRAQVKGLGARGSIVATEPYGDESQQLLADLIRKTKGYNDVKRTIHREEQQEPGLITYEGVLINANTRAVALRDLHAELPYDEARRFRFIKVQVLPQEATSDEIMQLEFDFQMRQRTQQDYTFTNELLFIKDLLDAGRSPEDIGLQKNRSYNPSSRRDRDAAAKEVQTEDRLRQIIEELIEASGGALGWEDFDDDRQNLLEIDTTYQTMSTRKSPDAARRVRRAKLVGLLAGMDYRRVRHIDESYLDGYVLPALEEEDPLRTAAQALAIGQRQAQRADVQGLSLLDDLDEDGPVTGSGSVTLQPLFDVLVRTGKVDPTRDIDAHVEVPTDTGTRKLPKSTFLDAVRHAMQTAADNKARDNQGLDALDVPRRQLNAAAGACDKVRRGYDELEDGGEEPNRQAVESALDAYLRAHDELIEYLAQRGFHAAENRQ